MKLSTIQTPELVKKKVSAPLPEYIIQERDAGKSKKLSYISGATVIDILNNTFGHLGWDFEIVNKWMQECTPWVNKYNGGVAEEQNPVAFVHGRLTVRVLNEKGEYVTVVKESFGSKSVIGKQNEQESTFKSAQTDALKKAASLLGIGADLYRGESEQAYYDVISKPIVWTDEKQASSPIWANALNLCSANGWAISDLDYYVNELTEGAYTDIYTLPEAWLESLLESLSEEEGE